MTTHESDQQPLPKVLYEGEASDRLEVNAESVAETMQKLGVSAELISRTNLFITPRSYSTNGSTWPKGLGRLRYRGHEELEDAEGPIVRINQRVKGRERSAEDMNRTLVHELEHVSQIDRNDLQVKIGHAAVWGLAGAGAIAGNQLGKSRSSKTAFSLLGEIVGHQAGYRLAPHEKQARNRSDEITASAITYRQ